MSILKNFQNWYLRVFVVFSFLFAICFSVASKPIIFVDDAWITFRYSHNLAYYGQLNFNLNENVEGITNGLWAVFLAVQMRFFSGSVVDLVLVNSFILTLLTLYRIWQIGVFLKVSPFFAVIPPLLLIVTPDYFSALTIGLETPLFSFLIVESIYWFIKGRYYIASLCFGLLFLVRPEAIIFGVVFSALLLNPTVSLEHGPSFVVRVFNFETRRQFYEFLKIVSVFLFIWILATVLRVVYYRDFLPNSVRAKSVQFDENVFNAGYEYIFEFFEFNLHFLIIFILGFFALVYTVIRSVRLDSNQSRLIWRNSVHLQLIFISVLIISLSFIVAIRNGGDWMPAYRLLSQYGALYSILLFALFGLTGKFQRVSVLAVVILFLLPFSEASNMVFDRVKSGEKVVEVYQTPGFPFWDDVAGRLSVAPLNSSDVVSAEGIGYISFNLPDVYMHDPLGLNDKHIAKFGNDASPFGKKDIRYTVNKVAPTVMVWQYVGHLKAVDSNLLDESYTTYCHDYCYSWRDADIVMVRKDRVDELGGYFEGWEQITIKELFERE